MVSSPVKAARWAVTHFSHQLLVTVLKLGRYHCSTFLPLMRVCVCRVSFDAASRTMLCTLAHDRGTVLLTGPTVTAVSTVGCRNVLLWVWAAMVSSPPTFRLSELISHVILVWPRPYLLEYFIFVFTSSCCSGQVWSNVQKAAWQPLCRSPETPAVPGVCGAWYLRGK